MSEALLRWLAATDNHGWDSMKNRVNTWWIPVTQKQVAVLTRFNALNTLKTIQSPGIRNTEITEILSKLSDKEFCAVYMALYQELYNLSTREISLEQAGLLTNLNQARYHQFPTIKESLEIFTLLPHKWGTWRTKMHVWFLEPKISTPSPAPLSP